MKINFIFQNPSFYVGSLITLFFVFVALNASWLAPFPPDKVFDGSVLIQPFSSSVQSDDSDNPKAKNQIHWLGTDDLGRDLFSRLLYGAQITLMTGFAIVGLSLFFGVLLGLWSGYYGGMIDQLVLRVVDVLMSLPSLLLALVFVTLFEPGLFVGVCAVTVVALPSFIKVTRSAVLVEKSKEYFQAAQSMGSSPSRLLYQILLPNCLGPIIVQATLGFSDGILNAAALGFLGLGAQAPTPEWGVMLSDAKGYIESAPYFVTLPGLCLLLVVIGFNLMGDGMRDRLDPKLRGAFK